MDIEEFKDHFSAFITDRPVIKSENANTIVVYSHWIGSRCIYVGSGKLKRSYEKYEYQRNFRWFDTVGDNIDKVFVKIESVFSNRIEAYDYEELLTKRMLDDGHSLANKYIGRKMSEESKEKMIKSLKNKMSGEKNPFHGEYHKDESIKKMLESKTDMSGKNHFRFGKPLSECHKRNLSDSKKGPRDLVRAIYKDGSEKLFEGYNRAGKEAGCDPNRIRQNVKSTGFYENKRTGIRYEIVKWGKDRCRGDIIDSVRESNYSEKSLSYDLIEVCKPDGNIFSIRAYANAAKGICCAKNLKKKLNESKDGSWKHAGSGTLFKLIEKGMVKNVRNKQ